MFYYCNCCELSGEMYVQKNPKDFCELCHNHDPKEQKFSDDVAIEEMVREINDLRKDVLDLEAVITFLHETKD